MSLAYRTPLPILKKTISAKEFVELQAFCRRNTLSPDIWKAMSEQTSWLYLALTGKLIEPGMLMPTNEYDHEAATKIREQQAENTLDGMVEG